VGLLFFAILSNLGRICETATHIDKFLRYQYLVTAMAENPASHKDDAVKGITIRSVFKPKLGIRHSMKSKNLS